jgi:rhodanese-related sulfurtransferase
MSNPILAKIQAGAKVIDVRTPDEFMDGAYPGAVNIPHVPDSPPVSSRRHRQPR